MLSSIEPTQINQQLLCECVWAGFPGKRMDENETIRQEGEGSGVNYRAFLLRCLREEGDGKSRWRFTLIKAGGEERQLGFASLDELVNHLREELNQAGVKVTSSNLIREDEQLKDRKKSWKS